MPVDPAAKKAKISAVAQFLEENDATIAQKWCTKKSVAAILSRYGIDPPKFAETFARKIIGYYIDVLRGKARMGACPAMNRVVDYLFQKGVGPKDVFLICMGFRRALFAVMTRHGVVTTSEQWLIDALSELFDNNLAGVLEYLEARIDKARKEAQRQEDAFQYAQRLQTILDLQDDMIFKLRDGKLYLANRAFYATLGVLDKKEFEQKFTKPLDFIEHVECDIGDFEAKMYDAWIHHLISRYDGECLVTLFDHRTNATATMRLKLKPLPGGGEDEVVGILRDITQQQAAMEELQTIAHTDALTGIANRRLFEEHLEMALKACKEEGTETRLLLIDLDDLTAINAKYGRDTGDLILKLFAETVDTRLGGEYFFARIDGDRFAVIMPEASIENATATAKWIAEELEAIHFAEAETTKANIAIVSCRPDDTKKRLLERAEKLTKQIVAQGGGGILNDTDLLEELERIEARKRQLLEYLQLQKELGKPVEAVNYYKEIPIQSPSRVVRIAEELVWIEVRKIAAHALRRHDPVFLKMPRKPNFIASVLDIDIQKSLVCISDFVPVQHSKLDRKNVHVQLEPPLEALLSYGSINLPAQIDTISVDDIVLDVPFVHELKMSDEVAVDTRLVWENRSEAVHLIGSVLKIVQKGEGYRIVITLTQDKTIEESVTPYVAHRQLEIIKDLKASIL